MLNERVLTERWAVTALRFFLVALFLLLLMLQTFSFPGQFASIAEENPDEAHLRWPLTAVAALLILCAQVVVVCTWRLLTLVTNDRIFSPVALRWVDVILGAVGAAWLIMAGLWTLVVLSADDPGAPVLATLLLLGVTVVGLLMVVMRALLRQATTLRTDMEAVI